MSYRYPLAKPSITHEDRQAVLSVLESPFLSLGPQIKIFERAFSEYLSLPYSVAVNSGTSALFLSLLALSLQKGDEVITTPFSFIASANAPFFVGARPRFVDIDPQTLNMDVSQIRRAMTRKTKAILAVHVFGLPCPMDALKKLTKEYNLFLIEDACEALGAMFQGQKCGTFGDLSCFGFYPNKQLTTGEGGMVCTRQRRLAERVQSLRNQGRSGRNTAWLVHERLGYNFRLDEMSCALGESQMKRLPSILRKRERLARQYHDLLKEVEEVEPLKDIPGYERSWFVYVIFLRKGLSREKVRSFLDSRGIQTGVYFPAIHLQPLYRRLGYRRGAFPETEDRAHRCLALPFYPELTSEDVFWIVKRLKEALARAS